MNQKQELNFCDVIDRASQHLRGYHRLSEKTIKRHWDNWHYLLDFAESDICNLKFEIVIRAILFLKPQKNTSKSPYPPTHSPTKFITPHPKTHYFFILIRQFDESG